jgi:hypothetical protein
VRHETRVGSAWIQRTKPKNPQCDEALPSVAFNFNLRRCVMAAHGNFDAAHCLNGHPASVEDVKRHVAGWSLRTRIDQH